MTDEDLQGCNLSQHIRNLYSLTINEDSHENADLVVNEVHDQDEFAAMMDPDDELKELRAELSHQFSFFLFLHGLYLKVQGTESGEKVRELIQVSDVNFTKCSAYASAIAFEKGYGGGWLRYRFSFYKLHEELLAK